MLLNKREKLSASVSRVGQPFSKKSRRSLRSLLVFASFGRPCNGFAAILAVSVLSLAALSTIGATVLYAVNRKNTSTADLKRNHAMMDVMDLLAYNMQEAIEYIPPGNTLTTLALGDTRLYVTKNGLKTGYVEADDLRLLFISGADIGCVEYDLVKYCAQYYRSDLPSTLMTIPLPGTPITTTTTTTHPPSSPNTVVSIGVINSYSPYCGGKDGSQVCRRCEDENTQCIDIVVCNTLELVAGTPTAKRPTTPTLPRSQPCPGDGLYYVQTVLLDMEELGLVINANPNVVKVGCNDYPPGGSYISLFDKRIENPYSPQITIGVHCLKKVPAPPSRWDQGKYYVMTEDFCFEKHLLTSTECPPPTDCGRCEVAGTCARKTCSNFGSRLFNESDYDLIGSDAVKQNCYDYVGTKCMFNNGNPLVCYLHTPDDPACQIPACNTSADCLNLGPLVCPGCTNSCGSTGFCDGP